MALPAPQDNTQANFDFGSNPANKNVQKKPQTLNQMGGTEVVPFDFGAVMAGQPAPGGYTQPGNAFPTPMMGNPYGANPYGANPNPY
jgi:hypothetical protein